MASTIDLIVSSLDADKGVDIQTINLSGKTSIADRMIVASGASSRQVGAMAEHVIAKLKARGRIVRSEGQPACDWVLIDVGDVIVHLFRPEVRAFYDIENLWSGARPTKSAKRA